MTSISSDIGTPNRIKILAQISGDKRSVSLSISIGDTTPIHVTVGAAELDEMIETLGDQRSEVLDPVSDKPITGKTYPTTFNPRWEIWPEPQNRFALLWIRDPRCGWHAYGLPRYEAASIAQWLRRLPSIKTVEDKIATLPPETTIIGGGEFLITTSGFGFYYFGKGENKIDISVFEQIEFDSDRAAGIVAGSVVERRLEDAIKFVMKEASSAKIKSIQTELFRPSGPLGSFATKISIAYLLNIISDDAHADLIKIKGIRNDYAHNLDMSNFDIPSIYDRCKNLILVDKHVGPIPSLGEETLERPTPYAGMLNHETKLADARFRYVTTAQLLSYRLGHGVLGGHDLPLI